MNNLYHNELLDHYRYPRHKGTMPNPDFTSRVHNPSCGDAVSWQGICRDGRIVALAFEGSGCVISQATASLLAEKVLGSTVAHIMTLNAAFIQELIGMELGPTRLKCALLPLEALQHGVAQCLTAQN